MAAHASRALLLICVVAVLSLYVLDFIRVFPRSIRQHKGEDGYVLQTGIAEFDAEMLREKQPIVIHDRLFDAAPFVREVFRYQSLFQRKKASETMSYVDVPYYTVARATFFSPKGKTGGGGRRRMMIRRRRDRKNKKNGGDVDSPPIGDEKDTLEDDDAQDDRFVLAARCLSRTNHGGKRMDEEEGGGEILFRLKTSQVLVLPPHWQVRCAEGEDGRDSFDASSYSSSNDENGGVPRYKVDIVESFDLLHLLMWVPMRLSLPFTFERRFPGAMTKAYR